MTKQNTKNATQAKAMMKEANQIVEKENLYMEKNVPRRFPFLFFEVGAKNNPWNTGHRSVHISKIIRWKPARHFGRLNRYSIAILNSGQWKQVHYLTFALHL